MRHLKVKLWGKEIGRLVWDASTRRSYFMYNPELEDDIPEIAPLLSPARSRNTLLPIYGDDRPIYQGLPPFIADSLPDSWGNTLFERWVKDNRIPRNRVTPLYKLMFIGSRGMGALEYEPYATDLTHTSGIDIGSLYDMSLSILENRDKIVLTPGEELTLQALLAVGTSAGGRQMKAIVAINDETGEIRSGQTDGLDGFDYYILKFGDKAMPIAEIETAYYDMAVAAGIIMEDCRILPVEGTNHFLTRRFDRADGKKLHVQTLAAINPDARSYEDLIATCRELSIPESEIEQIFTRMVFNVMANNTDDHNKNFSFILRENNRWRIAPAYDMTFIFDSAATGPNIQRRLSIGGKVSGITKADLIDFARRNDIRNVNTIMDRVATSIARFDGYAEQRGITRPWRDIIRKTLDDNLSAFGYVGRDDAPVPAFRDSHGRTVSDFSVAVNAKGHYAVSAVIDGVRRRRFVRPDMSLYGEMERQDFFNLPLKDRIRLTEVLFPPL